MGKSIAELVAGDIMTTRLVTLSPDMDVFAGIKILIKKKISGAPVVDGSRRLLGVFSEKCSMQVLMDAAYECLPTNEVRAFMKTDCQTVAEDANLLTIANFFLLTPHRRLPVLRDGTLVGQISRRDVIAAAAQQLEPTINRPKHLLYLSALRAMDDAPVS